MTRRSWTALPGHDLDFASALFTWRGELGGLSTIGYNWGSLTEISLPATEQYCYLTTTGRRTGRAHTVELWFAAEPGSRTIYILAGGGHRADWVKNLGTTPNAEVRIGAVTFGGTGRIVQEREEERLARRLVVAKYYGRNEVQSSGWEAEALPVAIDLELTKSS